MYTDRGVAVGTALSHYDRVIDIAATLPRYEFETDLFAPVPSPIFEVAPAVGGPNVSASIATRNMGEGYARSQAMQDSLRSGLYEAGPISNDAVVIATSEYVARLQAQVSTEVTAPIVRNALAFDFVLGIWVLATTTLQVPAAGVHIGAPAGTT